MSGIGTSAATIILLIGVLISASVLVPAVANVVDDVNDARQASDDRQLEQKNADFAITSQSRNDRVFFPDELTLTLENTGTIALSVSEINVLVDGELVDPEIIEVDGRPGSDVWTPGATLTVELLIQDDTDRVVVVIETGQSKATTV
jgi:flagellar protein FlaF